MFFVSTAFFRLRVYLWQVTVEQCLLDVARNTALFRTLDLFLRKKKHALKMQQIKSLSADSGGFEGSLDRAASLSLVAKAWQYALMYFRASSFSRLDDWMRSSTFPARIAQNT
jgi:hypothetical protein